MMSVFSSRPIGKWCIVLKKTNTSTMIICVSHSQVDNRNLYYRTNVGKTFYTKMSYRVLHFVLPKPLCLTEIMQYVLPSKQGCLSHFELSYRAQWNVLPKVKCLTELFKIFYKLLQVVRPIKSMQLLCYWSTRQRQVSVVNIHKVLV